MENRASLTDSWNAAREKERGVTKDTWPLEVGACVYCVLQQPPRYMPWLFLFTCIGKPDLVLSSVLSSLFVIFSTALCLLFAGSRSTLFRTTTMRGQVSSPISRHSAVCVCTPFTTSTTSIIRSMMWAPGEERKGTIVTKTTQQFDVEDTAVAPSYKKSDKLRVNHQQQYKQERTQTPKNNITTRNEGRGE